MTFPVEKMPRKPMVNFTAELKQQYLDLLRKSGLKYLNAELVGISKRTLDQHLKDDPEFKDQWDEAKTAYNEEFIIGPIREMALGGLQKPLIGGKERDTIIAYEKVLPVNLTAMILKEASPAHRDGAERDSGQSGPAGSTGDVQGFVAPRKSIDASEWKQRYQNAAKGLKPDGTTYES